MSEESSSSSSSEGNLGAIRRKIEEERKAATAAAKAAKRKSSKKTKKASEEPDGEAPAPKRRRPQTEKKPPQPAEIYDSFTKALAPRVLGILKRAYPDIRPSVTSMQAIVDMVVTSTCTLASGAPRFHHPDRTRRGIVNHRSAFASVRAVAHKEFVPLVLYEAMNTISEKKGSSGRANEAFENVVALAKKLAEESK
jgi:hypothetical protein